MAITINAEQRLYVITCNTGHSCLGFDVAETRRCAYLAWLKAPINYVEAGTVAAYDAYCAALARVIERCSKTGERCPAELTTKLIGLEGQRVEVTPAEGDTRRFYVGRSTGAIPIHLEIHNRRSSGGVGAWVGPNDKVRIVPTPRRRA